MQQDRMSDYTKYQQDAETIEAGYRKALEALSLREDLSQKGKAEERARLEEVRRNKVTQLQGVAGLSVRLDREHYTEELRKAKTAEFARVRRVLGDTVLADIYARRMSGMSAQAIVDWHSSAVDEWETTLLAQLGAAVLSSRKTKNDYEAQVNTEAVQRLLATPQNVVDIEDKLAALRDAETFVQRLDVNAYQTDFARRVGVDARYMPLPNADPNARPLQVPDERKRPTGFTEYFETPEDTPQEAPDATQDAAAQAQPVAK